MQSCSVLEFGLLTPHAVLLRAYYLGLIKSIFLMEVLSNEVLPDIPLLNPWQGGGG